MRVALELETLRFTHVHPDVNILGGLVYLECAKLKTIRFDDTESPNFLQGLTTLELTLLYRNMTSTEFPPGLDDLTRREVLAQVVDRMPVQTVVFAELEAQIEKVLGYLEAPIKSAVQFKYVHGAKVPRQLDGGLFPISVTPETADGLATAKQTAPQRRSLAPAPTVPATAKARAAKPPAAPRAPSGGSRPLIWSHADKVWEAAGKPTNKDDVLVLRKRMMTELELLGVKKTTSSTALGDWMKARLQ